MSVLFSHVTRPAYIPADPRYSDQSYFTGSPALGIAVDGATESTNCVKVNALSGDDFATVRIVTMASGLFAESRINMQPAALLELARCLIDAAHHISALPAAAEHGPFEFRDADLDAAIGELVSGPAPLGAA